MLLSATDPLGIPAVSPATPSTPSAALIAALPPIT